MVQAELTATVPAGTPAVPAAGRRHRGRGRGRFALLIGALTIGLWLSLTFAVTVGPVAIPLTRVWSVIGHHVLPGVFGDDRVTRPQDEIVWQLRVPRVLLGALVGAGLAVVGAGLQALVRNPLADPYVFGMTPGATVGATIVIVSGASALGTYSLSLAAFIGAIVAFVIVLGLARSRGSLSPIRLILAGVAVSYTMGAISSAILYLGANNTADTGAAAQVMFWQLGGLAGATWSQVLLPGLAVLLGTTLLLLHARQLNALLVGEETATTLGVDLTRFRRRVFTLSALMTGVIVAVSGGIGFVGLMLPHAVRILVGPDHRRVLPACVLLGAIYLVWADVLARTVAAPEEIPIGIVTALFGAPVFLAILRARHRVGGVRE